MDQRRIINWWRSPVPFLVMLLAGDFSWATGIGLGGDFIVTSTADSGAGSLREAIFANTTFAGVGSPVVAVRDLDLGRDWAQVGSGLTLNFPRGIHLHGGYDLQLNRHLVSYVGSGGFEFVW